VTKLTKADLVQKALTAARESKHIEFKEEFDPASPGEWCEVIKDIVAISNSGGGIIVFGLDDSGKSAKTSLAGLAAIDPADISNRITKYTGPVDLEIIGAKAYELPRCVAIAAESRGHMQACLQACGAR